MASGGQCSMYNTRQLNVLLNEFRRIKFLVPTSINFQLKVIDKIFTRTDPITYFTLADSTKSMHNLNIRIICTYFNFIEIIQPWCVYSNWYYDKINSRYGNLMVNFLREHGEPTESQKREYIRQQQS